MPAWFGMSTLATMSFNDKVALVGVVPMYVIARIPAPKGAENIPNHLSWSYTVLPSTCPMSRPNLARDRIFSQALSSTLSNHAA